MLIGVKLKHVLTMGDKSPGIRTPLYKETNIVPNDCCRICRIYVKISGLSKINVFGYNNKDFSLTLSSVMSAVYMTQRDYITYLYKVVFFFLQGNFHSVFADLYFAALNKLVYVME